MAEQVKKAWYKKWWVWVIAILVLAGIGTAISPVSYTHLFGPDFVPQIQKFHCTAL